MIRRLALFIGLLAALAQAGAATAHEVRPAYLEIQQTGAQAYAVTWKQPTLGDVAIHLVPHLSNGWLEATPQDQFANDGFLIRRWTIRTAATRPLEGVAVSVEGLSDTITDVLVHVRPQNASDEELILHPETPQALLSPQGVAPSGALSFLTLGMRHILSGPDHLLFVLGLFLIVRDRWTLVRTITAFTIAHSLTLALATLGGLHLPTSLLNALIALSILFVGIEAIRARQGFSSLTIRRPWTVAFAFGLLHGMGFAGGLTALGLERGALIPALAFFNIGVEIGQLAFLALVLALRRAFRVMAIRWAAPAALAPYYAVGVLGAMWTFQYGAFALGVG